MDTTSSWRVRAAFYVLHPVKSYMKGHTHDVCDDVMCVHHMPFTNFLI